MRKDKNIVFDEVNKVLQALGAEAKERRKSRCITMDRLCRDACISRGTLILIEKGSPNVSIGLYFDVLYLLGYRRYLWDLANARVHEPVRHGPDRRVRNKA